MGQPAARVGDMTAHGGVITGPGCPTVLIGGMPAARVGDMHVCPMMNPGLPPPPHVGGPICKGSTGVLIGGAPAARLGDLCTCAGPPATVLLGCPTVLIGEVGGGGGSGAGSGGAGGGGGSGSLVAASSLGLAIAVQNGSPPAPEAPVEHWIEFRFVDSGGMPVVGIPFCFKGSDGVKERGTLQASGRIRRERIPPGQCEVELFYVTRARWSKAEAKTSEELILTADTEGFEDGTRATITVFRRDVSGTDKRVAVLEKTVSGNRVEARWSHAAADPESAAPDETNPATFSSPVFFFTVEVKNCTAQSDLLRVEDLIEIELIDEDDEPVSNDEACLVLANGQIREARLGADGRWRADDLPPGKVRVEFKNHPHLAS